MSHGAKRVRQSRQGRERYIFNKLNEYKNNRLLTESHTPTLDISLYLYIVPLGLYIVYVEISQSRKVL